MIVKRVRLLVGSLSLILLCLAAPVTAQGPGTRFHRQSVDSPMSNGWVQAHSTEGHYSLEMPCAYNDSTATPENGGSRGHDLAFAVACDRQDGVRFFAMRVQYPGGGAAAQEMFGRRFAGHPLAGVAHMSDGQLDGRNYLDFDVNEPGRCVFLRLLRVGDDNLLMIVEPVNAPSIRCDTLRSDVDRFRQSLAVQQ